MTTSTGSPHVRRRLRLAAPFAALAIALAACGSDDTESADDTPVADSEADGADAGGALQQSGPISFEGTPLTPFVPAADDGAVGTAAPVVSGESFDGSAITIGGPTDGPTMVVFLAHWCPHCNDEVPELVSLEEAGSLPDGLEVVAVSTAVADDRDNYPPSDWFEAEDWPWPVMADDTDLTAFGVFGGQSFPYTALLDAEGNVLARRAGSAPADVILSFIDDALA